MARERLLRGGIAALSVALLTAPGVRAGSLDPNLDTTFGAGARFFDPRGTQDISGDILTLPDGRMILGGTSQRPAAPTQQDVVVTQRLPSGKPDTSFGGGDGVVFINVSSAALRDLALAPDGKIVGLAASATDTFLFRLNTDGSLDTDTDSVPSSHFDHDGIAHLNFGNSDEIWQRIAVQADGKVLAVGGVTPTVSDLPRTAVARFTSLRRPRHVIRRGRPANHPARNFTQRRRGHRDRSNHGRDRGDSGGQGCGLSGRRRRGTDAACEWSAR